MSAATPKRGKAAAGRTEILVPRLRIVFGEGSRLGPGKIDLLEAIGRAGSISAAGRALGMSYRRAWMLVDEVNRMFAKPVVTTAAGGAQGGGAHLTAFGEALVSAYRRIEARAGEAVREEMAPFAADILPAPEPQKQG